MLLAIVLMGACVIHSSHSDSNDQEWSAGWHGDHCTVEWFSKGKITWADDGRDVAKLSPGGTLTVVEETPDHSRRLSLAEKAGMLERLYRVDGAAHAWDADGADWLAAMLVQLDHMTGKLAPIRFQRLMAAGGPSAVLDDMKDAQGNERQTYIEMLVSSGKLGPAEACRIAEIADGITSDHDRADVLTDIAAQIDFGSASCRDAYFKSTGKINSDYERARAVIAAVDHAPTGQALDAFAIQALHVTREIASDHEKEHVLVTFAPHCTGDSARTAYLSTARTIASDAERARALTALVRQQ